MPQTLANVDNKILGTKLLFKVLKSVWLKRYHASTFLFALFALRILINRVKSIRFYHSRFETLIISLEQRG